MAKDVRYSDVFKNGNGQISFGKVLSVLSIVVILFGVAGASTVALYRVDKTEEKSEQLEGLQKTDHDTIIRVETKVDQIQMEQTEMRHDLKHIIRKLDNEG